MQKVTLKIPDKKLNFFMELVNQLGIEIINDIDIPTEHSKIVLKRMEKSKKNPNRLLNWENVKNNFDLK